MTETYLRSLTFGGLTIENNLLQAPLAGYSGAPFRLLSWSWGRPGLLATEMISAKALVHEAPRQERYLARLPGEGPVAYQLWGNDPEALGPAAAIVSARGADVVDLNCGCPVRKVRAAGAGSKLMEEPALVERIVRAMRAHTEKPVTVKIRVGNSAQDYNGPAVARAAENGGAHLITVHGRHAKERYSHPVRLEQIARVVEAVNVPVIGNGDVTDAASAKAMMDATACAGWMIGRGCMGAPWVFAAIRAGLTGEAYAPPTLQEMGKVLLEHHDMLAEIIGADLAVRHCRKLGSFYSKRIHGAKEFRNRLNYCLERKDLVQLIAEFFGYQTA